MTTTEVPLTTRKDWSSDQEVRSEAGAAAVPMKAAPRIITSEPSSASCTSHGSASAAAWKSSKVTPAAGAAPRRTSSLGDAQPDGAADAGAG